MFNWSNIIQVTEEKKREITYPYSQNTVFWRKQSHQNVVSVIIKCEKIKVPNSNKHKLCFILNMHIKNYNILKYSVSVVNVSSDKPPFLSFLSKCRPLYPLKCEKEYSSKFKSIKNMFYFKHAYWELLNSWILNFYHVYCKCIVT
jgi:hypothetical protein